MKEEAIARFNYPEEFKEKLIELVVYQNYSKEEVAKKYGLVNTYILTNWIIGYKKKLEKGAVTLVSHWIFRCLVPHDSVTNTI